MAEDVNVIYPESDLKALLIEGDRYTERVDIIYLGKKFEVPVRCLNDLELGEVMKSLKDPKLFAKAAKMKKKMGTRTELTDEEKESFANDLLSDPNVTESAYASKVLNQEFCKRGIVDDELRALVPKFKWGLTDIIGKAIQRISSVPPVEIINFLEARKG